MGNNPPPPAKKPTMEQTIIQMKMTGRKFAMEAKKAEKEQKTNFDKAKLALKKNNQEGAKLYLVAAANKKAEAMNLQRMSMKMDTLVTTVKSGNSNQLLMGSFNKITNLLQYSKQPNIEVMASDLQNFERCMDEMLINGKVMNEVLSKDSNSDIVAEDMMDKLKQQMALETETQLNEAAKMREKQLQDEQFMNKLRDL